MGADKPKIGMIGDGNVGTALTNGLSRAGYEVRAVGKEPGKVKEIGAWADVLFLAVPFGERANVVRELDGAYAGKVVVDVSNAMGENMTLAIDPLKESGAEEVARLAAGAKVVKAFNTVFAQHMDKGELYGEKLTVLAAGDDARAKERVLALARDIGFDGVDAGPLANARWLETLGFLNIQLGYNVGLGPTIGFKLVHAGSAAQKADAAPSRAARQA